MLEICADRGLITSRLHFIQTLYCIDAMIKFVLVLVGNVRFRKLRSTYNQIRNFKSIANNNSKIVPNINNEENTR